MALRVREIRIPKGDGRVRVVYAPEPDLKDSLRGLLGKLEEVQRKTAKQSHTAAVPHGCLTLRSPVTMARPHAGPFAWTVTVDLTDAFDSCGHLVPKDLKKQYPLAFMNGRPPQGFPTSPVLCNIAFAGLDKAILRDLRKLDKTIVYTRYVDDLAVSGPLEVDPKLVLKKLAATISRLGLKLSQKKTRIQLASGGRRVIVGLSVGNEKGDVKAPRRTRRRLRAAKHNAAKTGWRIHKKRAKGLGEWCKCKPPTEKKPTTRKQEYEDDTPEWIRKRVDEAKIVAKHWKLRITKADWEEITARQVPDEFYREGETVIVITSDPVYMLGASTITNGWKSCLRQPGGKYRTSTKFWARLSGARIAYLPGSKDMNVKGVIRKQMAARVWIWDYKDQTDSTVKVKRSRRYYGGSEAVRFLTCILDKVCISPLGRGEVLGSVTGTKGSHGPYTEGGISKKRTFILDTVTKRRKRTKFRFNVS